LPAPAETGWFVPTILVADDNSNIQKMVGIALKEHGIEVIAVGNGEAAVRKLAEAVPDLILADIFMPVRNGYEVCEYVKKDDRFAHVPVVLLVGAFDPLDEREVERVHADGVLKKPFVPPDPLIELVKSLLEKAAAPAPAEEAAPAGAGLEDVEQTQDISAGLSARSPTGTVRIPAPEPPPTERTQRLEPEPPARMSSGTVEVPRPEIPPVERTQRLIPEAPLRSGTVEVPRPEIPPADRTQRLEPEGTPVGAESFKLGLDEPPPPPAMEKTQQLNATDISKILSRESSLAAPTEAEEEEIALPPSAVDFHGEESPVAFEDMLRPVQEEKAEEEEKEGELEHEAFEAAGEHTAEGAEDEAEIRFGGIREEAKSPDPELPPIPVDFGHSEPMEIITDEHGESSEHEIGPTEDLVSSSSGWAASTAGGAQTGEPELVSEGSEGFMTPPPAPMRGIASEEAPPAPEFAVPAGGIAGTPAEPYDETTELPKHILKEEVARAQEIAARVAAQNREFLVQEEAAGAASAAPLAGPGIDQAISVADTLLARHRAQIAAAEASAASAAATAPAALPPAPAAPFAPASAFTQEIAATAKVSRPAGPELIEAIAERVLSQLDPYIIEKISKEIVRPIVEAMIRKELEKQD
jgi:CheY-like chemotaxis protein